MSWLTGDVNNGPGVTNKNNKNTGSTKTTYSGGSGSTNKGSLDGTIYDDVNGTGYGNGEKFEENTALNNYGGSSNDYWDDYLSAIEAQQEAQQEAINAAVQQNVNTLNAQKGTTAQDYADAYRQLYLNNMNSQKNIGQQMAAQGVTGGASESTLLGLNTNYEDNLRQGKVAEQNAMRELDQAIANAQLSGSIEAANAAATTGQNMANAYLTAWQQQQANEQAAQQLAANQASENRSYNYQMAMAMLNAGSMPSDELLNSAGISKADAQTIVAKVAATKVGSGSKSGSKAKTTDGVNKYGYYGTQSNKNKYNSEAEDMAMVYNQTGSKNAVLEQLNKDYTSGLIDIATYKSLQNAYKNL